ncbi:uncharacterized protein LOC128234735 [Mya arenaria]|uniref:uncharacterized protein LOC128234735 n=1 Tax=Mya arenaria TaxID=6604 RepID=UPI0022E88A8D|nr:uncharacterized protein LOC128234735 [Mya arenaria]
MAGTSSLYPMIESQPDTKGDTCAVNIEQERERLMEDDVVNDEHFTREDSHRNADLEEHLELIFRRKLHFPYEDKEVVFVQSTVEALVTKIVVELIANKERLFDKFGETDLHTRLEPCPDRILHVGSFYERTRNRYPNEFDFVYIPYQIVVDENTRNSFLKLNVPQLQQIISDLTKKGDLRHRDAEMGEITFERYVAQHGPASNVRFRYNRNPRNLRSGQHIDKEIDVDLVPGIRVIDKNMHGHIKNICPIPGFQKQILATSPNKYLWVPFSFTALNETEVYFMRHVLSKKHVKAYRLLKYVINGDGDGDDLEAECTDMTFHIKCSIPSYAIKTAMIWHHYECCDDSQDLGDCLVRILEWFERKFQNPIKKIKDNFENYHVDIVAPSNKIITLAYGTRDFIRDGERSLRQVIDYCREYRMKRHGHDSDIDSFSTRMVLCVARYEVVHGPWYRRYRQSLCRPCGVPVSGKLCYNVIVTVCVITIIIVLVVAFKPEEDEI